MLRFLLTLVFLSFSLWGTPRVVILGFDGVDYHYVQKYMKEGKLPNLQQLAQEGAFLPLLPPIPAQTPVSWSTFTTGLTPGEHKIFDFLKRDIQTYMPSFAVSVETKEPFLFGHHNKYWLPCIVGILVFLILILGLKFLFKRWRWAIVGAIIGGILSTGVVYRWIVPWIPPYLVKVHNQQEGLPFWEVLAQKGYRCKVFRMPVTFPPKAFPQGHLLSGLGVPDLSLRIGKPFYFTSELFLPPGSNEFSVEVVELPDNQGTMETKIVGPPNKLFQKPAYLSIPMTLTVSKDRKSLLIQVQGKSLTLTPGAFSDWVDFTFAFNPLLKVRGVGRFYLVSLEPEIRLYLSPINFDPRHLPPGFALSHPRSWAGLLAKTFGLYKTIGWSVDTWSVSEELMDEAFFNKDWQDNVTRFGGMLEQFLGQKDDLLFFYFEFTDRVGHIFWRLLDTEHPYYNKEKADLYGRSLEEAYRQMDKIVGHARQALQKDDHLIVCSDHGFASFRWAVNYNTWLVQEGYMALKGSLGVTQNLQALFDQGEFWPNVDWGRTRAYCLGLGGLYINLRGRESRGIVNPGEEYESLRRELIQRLESWVDPRTGLHPVAKIYTREEAYHRFDPQLIPDLIVTNNPGYRVSWQTSLGGMPPQTIEDNAQVWSGDHCSLYPPAVPGILITNLKLKQQDTCHMVDIYPTILSLFQVKPPYELPGHSLR